MAEGDLDGNGHDTLSSAVCPTGDGFIVERRRPPRISIGRRDSAARASVHCLETSGESQSGASCPQTHEATRTRRRAARRRRPERLPAGRRTRHRARRRDRPTLNQAARRLATARPAGVPHPRLAPPRHCSFAARGGPWPVHCVAGTQAPNSRRRCAFAPGATWSSRRRRIRDREAYSAFDGTPLAEQLRRAAIAACSSAGSHRLLRARHGRDARAAGLEAVVLRTRCAPSTCGRVTASVRWRNWQPQVRAATTETRCGPGDAA